MCVCVCVGGCLEGFWTLDPLPQHGLVAFGWNSIWHLTKVTCVPSSPQVSLFVVLLSLLGPVVLIIRTQFEQL